MYFILRSRRLVGPPFRPSWKSAGGSLLGGLSILPTESGDSDPVSTTPSCDEGPSAIPSEGLQKARPGMFDAG